MPVELNHTIIHSNQAQATIEFMCEVLGLRDTGPFGPFLCMETDNQVSLDVYPIVDDTTYEVQHYAFLVTEGEFDQIWDRIRARDVTWYADPGGQEPGEIYQEWGGRGLYFAEPGGNWLEILTVPYGGWSEGDPRAEAQRRAAPR